MLQRILFVTAVIISIVLQQTSGDNNNERPVDGKQYKKNGIINGQKRTPQKPSSSLNNQLITSRSEKISNFRSDPQLKSTAMTQSLINFKRSPQASSNVIHTQRDKKPPKQKIVGVPAGIVASGYFLISAWTDAGCTGNIKPAMPTTILTNNLNLTSFLNLTLTDVQVW